LITDFVGSIFIFAALAIMSWPIVRAIRLYSLREQARQKMPLGAQEVQALGRQMSDFAGQPLNQAELAAYGTLTVAEFAWSWARIDPSVINAADFSSSVSVHNGYEFAQYIHSHYDALDVAAQEGFFNRLMGYVGEQKVADLLVHQGHIVQAAASATQPAWDLLVDGHPVNVKTVYDLASIKAEALAHHGVTYIVPTDAHGHLGSNMLHVAGFHHDSVHSSLHEGIAAAHGEHALHGLGMHLPMLTVAFSAYRNYRAVQMGKDVSAAVKHFGVESVGRGTGGFVGFKTGAAVGGLVTAGNPLGIAVGATIGAIGGGLFGGSLAEQYKRKPLDAAILSMKTALHNYGATFSDKLDAVLGYLEAPLIRLQSSLTEVECDLALRHSRLMWWLWPDFYTVLLEETARQGHKEAAALWQETSFVTHIIQEARQLEQFEKIGVMMANHPAVSELVGDSPSKLAAVHAARKAVFHERKQLKPQFVAPV
jgi:hypothetical protein